MNGEIRVAEMFAGVGGFRLGLERTSCRYKIIWANEKDKTACQIYRKNFGNNELIQADIKTIDTKDIPNHDLLVGGFPCQPFSSAGKREGFSDIRGTLFFEIARVLKDKRPKVFLLENVAGLLSAQRGYCFFQILNTLDELGYNVEWKVLNTKNWLPQNRPRVFIIGHSRDRCTRNIFPFFSYDQKGSQAGEVAGTLQGGGHSGGLHSNMTAIAVLLDNLGGNIKKRVVEDGDAWCLGGSKTGVASCVDTHGYLRKMGHHTPDKHGLTDYRVRRFTKLEEERLQGFSDGWTEGVSNTLRSRLMGNAVSIPVISYLGKLLLEAF